MPISGGSGGGGGGGGGGGAVVTTLDLIHTISNVTSLFLTPILEAQGTGSVTCSVDADATGGAIFLNIFKNNVRQEQLTATGGPATYTFTPLGVVASDQVYVTFSNGGGVIVSGGTIDLTQGFIALGQPIPTANPIS